MNGNKRALAIAAHTVLFGVSNPPQASTLEQRLELMEKRMQQMEQKLDRSEAENTQLRQQLATQKGSTNASTPTAGQSSEVKLLNDKVATLEKKIDQDKKASTEAAKNAPKVELGSTGLSIKSADENFRLSLRGYVQTDGNFFMDDSSGDQIADKFTLRRARLTLEGSVFKYVDFRLAPDFGGGQTRLFDAFADFHYFPQASLMVGKFRQPVSLERMQTAPNLTFVERAYPAQLAPNRDIGVMLHGAIPYPGYTPQYAMQPAFREFLGYELGVFNGIRDNQAVQNSDSDKDDNKEFAGRLFSHPFLHSGIEALQGLGLGIAGTWGQPRDNTLPNLVTPGQQTLLSYGNGITSSGNDYRVYPQMYYYYGPFGMMAEYLISSQRLKGVSKGQSVYARQNNDAWQVNLSYVLTGENNSFFGIKPAQPFDPFAGTWGAFQVAARWSQLDIDDETFVQHSGVRFADPSKSASKATSWALGMNWYLNTNIKLMGDYEQTYFQGGASRNKDRPTEKVFFTRFQFAF